jgi:hypothetical protein
MADDPILLTDQEVQQFIVSGYTIVQADYPPAFHEAICTKLDGVLESEGNMGNNILPRVPEIAHVFEHPGVRGALTSLLGEGYVMNPHRHCHMNPAQSKGQNWHKDCYVYDHNLRHPRLDWVLAFYYPQNTTMKMGPSAILPGSQHLKRISSPKPDETSEDELPVCGPAGTIALIHFDTWHRASANTSNKNRYMLKFQFARTQPHGARSWDHKRSAWSPGIPDTQPRVSRDVWDWLLGESTDQETSETSVEDLAKLLDDPSETRRLNAAYELASKGEGGISALVSNLRMQSLDTFEETTATTPDNAHGTNPTPAPAVLALSSAGKAAIPAAVELTRDSEWWIRALGANILYRLGKDAEDRLDDLVKLYGDEHWWVRRNAVEAVGEVGVWSEGVARVVASGLSDEDYRVRRSACLAVTKFGSTAADLVPDVAPVLEDENRYNRFYATLALRRIGTPEASELMLADLFTARWCPLTTKDDRY